MSLGQCHFADVLSWYGQHYAVHIGIATNIDNVAMLVRALPVLDPFDEPSADPKLLVLQYWLSADTALPAKAF